MELPRASNTAVASNKQHWLPVAAVIVGQVHHVGTVLRKSATSRTGQDSEQPKESGRDIRRSDSQLAATKAPIVVTSHPHRYTFSIISITPSSWQLNNQRVPGP